MAARFDLSESSLGSQDIEACEKDGALSSDGLTRPDSRPRGRPGPAILRVGEDGDMDEDPVGGNNLPANTCRENPVSGRQRPGTNQTQRGGRPGRCRPVPDTDRRPINNPEVGEEGRQPKRARREQDPVVSPPSSAGFSDYIISDFDVCTVFNRRTANKELWVTVVLPPTYPVARYA